MWGALLHSILRRYGRNARTLPFFSDGSPALSGVKAGAVRAAGTAGEKVPTPDRCRTAKPWFADGRPRQDSGADRNISITQGWADGLLTIADFGVGCGGATWPLDSGKRPCRKTLTGQGLTKISEATWPQGHSCGARPLGTSWHHRTGELLPARLPSAPGSPPPTPKSARDAARFSRWKRGASPFSSSHSRLAGRGFLHGSRGRDGLRQDARGRLAVGHCRDGARPQDRFVVGHRARQRPEGAHLGGKPGQG
jgi:hypothetical protein